MADDDMRDFERETFSHTGETKDIYRSGTGPAVIVMAEMPGITPKVLTFARRVVDLGCTAVLPHLFGRPGHDPLARGPVRAAATTLRTIVPACVSREFTVLARGRTSPSSSTTRMPGRVRCRRTPS